ncbi:MAG: 3-coathanger stack domain-containing protein [Saprospiraceae bacterium]
MNYFDKIEGYTTGTLSEMERSIFEMELPQNTALQQELEAHQLAESLFDFAGANLSEEPINNSDAVSLFDELINFTASNLSEEQILAPTTTTAAESADLVDSLINFTASNLSEAQILASDSTELADELINFTASNLSEKQILGATPIGAKTSIIRRLQVKSNRTAWLAAASMLFILSMIGSQFYTDSSLGQSSGMVAEMPAVIEKSPVKAIITNPFLEEVVAIKIPKKEIKKNYPPAKIRVIKKITPSIANEQLAVVEMDNAELNTAKTILENPIAMNTVAKEISTSAIISKGQNTSYQATTSITLTSGFSAPPGTSFTAMTTQKTAPQEVNSNNVISEKESVLIKANTAITLKPGFHAKAGASFKAEIGK